MCKKDWSKKERPDLDVLFLGHLWGIYGGRKFTIYGARSLHKLGIVVSLSLSHTKKKKMTRKQAAETR